MFMKNIWVLSQYVQIFYITVSDSELKLMY